VKELKNRNTEFHTYKPKQDRGFKVLKNIHATMNVDDIRKGIENQGYTITNIWNIKKQSIGKALPMFYVKLKLENINKDIYEVRSLLQCKIKFEPLYPKHEIPQRNNCQQYDYTRSFCFRKV
jgi:hypothetical protein